MLIRSFEKKMMRDEEEEQLCLEDLAVNAVLYWSNAVVLKSSDYFNSISEELIDDKIEGLIRYDESEKQAIKFQTGMGREELVSNNKKEWVERFDKCVDEFFKEKPRLSQVYYFANIMAVNTFMILSRTQAQHSKSLDVQKEYKENYRRKVGEESASKIDEKVKPLFESLKKELNNNYKKLFGETIRDKDIQERILMMASDRFFDSFYD